MQNSMKRFRFPLILALLALVITLIALASSSAVQQQAGPKQWRTANSSFSNMPFSQNYEWIRYRPPAKFTEDSELAAGGIPLDASLEEARALTTAKSMKVQYGPNPEEYRKLLGRENALLEGEMTTNAFGDDEYLGQPQKYVLAVVTEFDPPGGEEVMDRNYFVDPEDPSQGCSVQPLVGGPLFLGDDPAPPDWDNFEFYKDDISNADYEKAIFSTGPDAGYGVVRGVDLSGFSLNNYLIEMNPEDSPYTTDGGILPMNIVLPHSHEYYGYEVYTEDDEGVCYEYAHDARNRQHIQDTVAAVTAKYDGDPSIDWSKFDADGDKIVDLFSVIRAGKDQSAGGVNRIWAHSSQFSEPVQIVGFTTPDDESDDYYVFGYNSDPEQLGVGVIQEEFEHQFGIPDFYTTDIDNSNAWWTSHSNGAWGGPLGGTRPMGSGLYASWVLGRKSPVIYEWNDPALLAFSAEDGEKGVTLKLARARNTPQVVDDAEDGAIIRLPQGEIFVDNEAGEGTAWWSDSGDLLDNQVYREFDLSGATGQVIFSFDSSWDIEEDWDYGLIQFSTDGGTTWAWPQDMDGVLTDQDPNDLGITSPGERWALTGAGAGNLRWDLSAYAGQTVMVMIRYYTDGAVANPGYQVDNLLLVDDSGTLYENDLEEDFSDWTNDGWIVVPFTQVYERYYLLEYRVANGFDESLNNVYRYNFYDYETGNGHVDRLPATDEVLIVNYRDQSQGFDYTLSDATFTGNAIGAKFAHLVVDSHPFPQMWSVPDPNRDDLVGVNMSSRVVPGDAGFGLNMTESWTADYEWDPVAGGSGQETWDGREPVQAFHDSYGYTPGLFYSPDTGYVYFWHQGASAVLPAKGPYSTSVTDVDGNPFADLYGATVAGFELGTGNPGDDHQQYGIHAQVLSSTDEYVVVNIWNKPYEAEMEALVDVHGVTTFNVAENIGGKLEMPYLVVELPEGVEYVADSTFGGFMPAGGETSDEALAAVQAGNAPNSSQAVNYMVWTGDDIGTAKSVELGGFEVNKTSDGDVIYPYTLYREGTVNVQDGHLLATPNGQVVYMPLATRK